MGELDAGWYQNGVSVQGDVDSLNWTPGSNMLIGPDEEIIFSGDVVFPAGSYPDVNYKFTRKDADSTWTWESCNNRSFTINDSNSTQILNLNYWNDVVPTPQNVVVEIDGNDVDISWDAVVGNPAYAVYRDTDPYGTFETQINTRRVTCTFFIDVNAASETKYFYEVKAITE